MLAALLAAVVPAAFYLGGELARLDQGQADLKAGLARLETRMDSMTTRMETLFAEIRTELRENRAEVAKVQDSVAAVRTAKGGANNGACRDSASQDANCASSSASSRRPMASMPLSFG